jgi:translation initiation factor IF-2
MSAPTQSPSKLAEEEGLKLHYYSVIYELIDDVKQAMVGMLKPEFKEEIIGLAEVRQVFRSPKFGVVAGCMVVDGVVRRNNPIRVLRNNVVIFEGALGFVAALQGRRQRSARRDGVRDGRAQLQRHP